MDIPVHAPVVTYHGYKLW